MSKQKSYVITDAADQMAAELGESNGLAKSAIIEVLIRQAHAAGWTIASSVNLISSANSDPSCGVYPAARLLGVTQSTISGWSRADGGLPFVQMGHKRVYKQSELLEFAIANGRRPAFETLEQVYLKYPNLRGK